MKLDKEKRKEKKMRFESYHHRTIIIIMTVVVMVVFAIAIFYSTPGLGRAMPPGKAFDYVRWLEGQWICWIPGTHCITVPATK
jgi:hypothetical protein